VARTNRKLFAEHAAPEAIEAALSRAYAKRREVGNTITWLTRLRADRACQIMLGEWPKPNDQPCRGCSGVSHNGTRLCDDCIPF